MDEMTPDQARTEIAGIVARLKPRLVIEFRGKGVTDKGWVHHRFNLSVTVETGEKQSFPYKAGLAHVDKDWKPTMPDPLKVLACHASDAQLSDLEVFRVYCEDAGLEPDSEKAEDIFRACLRSDSKLGMLGFTKEEIRRMGELHSCL